MSPQHGGKDKLLAFRPHNENKARWIPDKYSSDLILARLQQKLVAPTIQQGIACRIRIITYSISELSYKILRNLIAVKGNIVKAAFIIMLSDLCCGSVDL